MPRANGGFGRGFVLGFGDQEGTSAVLSVERGHFIQSIVRMRMAVVCD